MDYNKCSTHVSLVHECIPKTQINRSEVFMLSSVKEKDEVGNNIIRTKFVKYNPNELLRTLSARDFSIQNLMSVGAELRFVSLSMDNHSAVDNIKSELSKINSKLNDK